MMKKEFREALEDSPIITAVKDEEGLAACLESESRVVFILYGDICNIAEIVERVHAAGKLALVHLDLILGLASKEIAVDFLKLYAKADGIISTKPALVRRAKDIDLYSVLRVFVIDSMAYEHIEKQTRQAQPDVIEILPAMMPKVVKKICSRTRIPVIAGGLVSEKEDVMALLQSGVVSVSTTDRSIWFI